MSLYSKVTRRMWHDAKFRELSAAPPNGQTLWLYLLTGPHNGRVPGLFVSGEAAMAEALGWDLEGFREAFREVSAKGMAKADWKARLVWLPKAIVHNEPASPNVILGWRHVVQDMPECELKTAAIEGLSQHIDTMGKAFGKAFAKAFGEPSERLSGSLGGIKNKNKNKNYYGSVREEPGEVDDTTTPPVVVVEETNAEPDHTEGSTPVPVQTPVAPAPAPQGLTLVDGTTVLDALQAISETSRGTFQPFATLALQRSLVTALRDCLATVDDCRALGETLADLPDGIERRSSWTVNLLLGKSRDGVREGGLLVSLLGEGRARRARQEEAQRRRTPAPKTPPARRPADGTEEDLPPVAPGGALAAYRAAVEARKASNVKVAGNG